ncbi:MAG: ABC transporter permease [Pseudomonadales bacterium]|nr:ABC transporter permease [Pseudomonadales bacterium]NIX08941.1 ABC transporter permease [Pseudomonadales bacterium]
MQGLPEVSIGALLVAFLPSLALLAVMRAWSLEAGQALIANVRMLVQLLAIGYVLLFVFDTESPWIVAAVLVVMMGVAAWIALRPLESRGARKYVQSLAAISICGLAMLALVSQVVIDLPRWFEPRFVVPLAGMIFANAMNTVSLAAERFESEQARVVDYVEARTTALDAALIPQINALLAVGLVSLPGMMTGQILSGVDPLIAVRYQIVVMCMIFGSSGLAAVAYLFSQRPRGA